MKYKSKYLTGIIFLLIWGCAVAEDNPGSKSSVREIIVLYTNDEHGWLEPNTEHGGSAAIMSLWKEKEEIESKDNILILSGGDNWTGPAISTTTKGKAMVEIMNEMGYDASAIGNHEFDFGIAELRARVSEANFTYLAANIRETGTNNIPDFATPYIIKEVNGVKIGIIGLSTIHTPSTTLKENVKDYYFAPYDETLYDLVPVVRMQGAQLIFLVCHVCAKDMGTLVEVASDLGITLVGAGHCHRTFQNVTGRLGFVEAHCYYRKYARVSIEYDIEDSVVVDLDIDFVENSTNDLDGDVMSIVETWRVKAGEMLNEHIGYTTDDIGQYTNGLQNLICDSWLKYFPDSHVSIMNRGGIRQGIPAGEITFSTIMGILPFENEIYEIDLTGSELKQCLDGNSLLLGGLTTKGSFELINGEEILPDSLYSVLLTNYVYEQTESYRFKEFDSEFYSTSINWRLPLIEYIKSLNTNEDNSLHIYLDNGSRR